MRVCIQEEIGLQRLRTCANCSSVETSGNLLSPNRFLQISAVEKHDINISICCEKENSGLQHERQVNCVRAWCARGTCEDAHAKPLASGLMCCLPLSASSVMRDFPVVSIFCVQENKVLSFQQNKSNKDERSTQKRPSF